MKASWMHINLPRVEGLGWDSQASLWEGRPPQLNSRRLLSCGSVGPVLADLLGFQKKKTLGFYLRTPWL